MRKGLTLIEIVIAVAIVVILTGIYFLASNPAGQLAASRNSERKLHLQTIMQGICQNVADQSNQSFSCAAGSIPTSSMDMGSSAGEYNLAPCLMPTYLAVLPYDPSASGAHFVSVSDYDTGYSISITTSTINSSTRQILLSAPGAERVNGNSTTITLLGCVVSS